MWALISVNGMVVGAVFWVAILDRVVRLWITSLWAFVAVCGYWDLAAVAVCRGRVVFVCLLFEGDMAPAYSVKKVRADRLGKKEGDGSPDRQ